MRIRRAILYGSLLWVLIFFEVSILMFGLNLEGLTYYLIHYLVLIFLSGVTAVMYFKKKGIRANAGDGFFVGIVFVLTGILLDVLITVPLFIKDYSFFVNGYLWIGIIEIVFITSIVGGLMTKKKRRFRDAGDGTFL